MSSSQSEERKIVFTREKNDTSNKNRERYFFTCEKNDTSDQKPQSCASSAPKFPPVIGAFSLQRRFADIQREKFFSKRLSRKKSEKHLGNWSGIVSFVSLSMKKTVKSRQNNRGRGKTERDVS